MQHLFFKPSLKTERLEKYLQSFKEDQNLQNLKVELKQTVKILESYIDGGSDEEKYFFRNYEKLISLVYDKNEAEALNFSLHWINLYGQRLLEVNKIKEATEVLECALGFMQNQSIDRLLLCTALNNLSLLYKKKSDFGKSLNLLIQNIDICVESIKQLTKPNQVQSKQKIELFAVVLVNGFKNAKNVVSQLLASSTGENIQELEELKKNFNKLGYESCVTYLGKKSYFTQFFQPVKKSLPFIQKIDHVDTQTQHKCQQPVVSIDEKTFKSFESEMLHRLETIETMLKQKQTVMKTEQFSEPKETQTASQIIQQVEVQEIQPEPAQPLPINELLLGVLKFFAKGNKLDEESFEVNGWNVQIDFVKVFGEVLGKLEFKCTNKEKDLYFTHKIIGSQLQAIMNLTSLEDTMPYEHSLSDLPPNFITVCIKPYFSITEEGKIEFYPKSKGLTHTYLETKFVGNRCYISVNHIKGTTFRIGIAPIEQSGSVYLNVQFTEENLFQIMEELIDPIPIKIKQKYEKTFLSTKKKGKQKNSSNAKSLIVKNFKLLEEKIQEIVRNFEEFLLNDEEMPSGKDLLEIIETQNAYFRFLEVDSASKGIFFRVSYMKCSKAFSIYAEETSLKVENLSVIKKKTNGGAIFDQAEFEEVFGFPLDVELIKQKLKKIKEIICQKYYLNLKRAPQNLIRESYNPSMLKNNFILEKSFTFHNFHVEFIRKPQQTNYFYLVTASILTVSSNYPLGIKINLYNPEEVTSKGYFISLCPEDWRFDNIFQGKGDIVKGKQLNDPLFKTQEMFKKHNEKYPCSENYFLDYWMKKEGFREILSKVVNEKSGLYLEKNINSIVNWTKIFQE